MSENIDWTVVVDNVSGREIIVNKEPWKACGENLEFYFSNNHRTHILNTIRSRASVDEVIEFANKVRKAGGGNIIDSLMPSEPENAESCLIANALNFDCLIEPDIDDNWCMNIGDVIVGEKIAEELGLSYRNHGDSVEIELPNEIALVAKAFDSCVDYELETYNIDGEIIEYA